VCDGQTSARLREKQRATRFLVGADGYSEESREVAAA
jgi:hypothetical protein